MSGWNMAMETRNIFPVAWSMKTRSWIVGSGGRKIDQGGWKMIMGVCKVARGDWKIGSGGCKMVLGGRIKGSGNGEMFSRVWKMGSAGRKIA